VTIYTSNIPLTDEQEKHTKALLCMDHQTPLTSASLKEINKDLQMLKGFCPSMGQMDKLFIIQ